MFEYLNDIWFLDRLACNLALAKLKTGAFIKLLVDVYINLLIKPEPTSSSMNSRNYGVNNLLRIDKQMHAIDKIRLSLDDHLVAN